jgi:hypothetical protein
MRIMREITPVRPAWGEGRYMPKTPCLLAPESDTPNSLTMVADRFYPGCLRWLVVADSGWQGTFGKEPSDLNRSIPLREGTNDGPQNRLLHCSRGASRREPMEFTFPSFRPACLLALHFQWEDLHVTGDNGSIL